MGRLPAIQIMSELWMFSSSADTHSEIRPRRKDCWDKGISIYVPQNFQTKICKWVCFRHLVSLTIHKEISMSGGYSFLLNLMDWSLINVVTKFVRVSPTWLQVCCSDYRAGCGFLLWSLTVKVQSQGRWKSMKQRLDLKGFSSKSQFSHHAFMS